jgi:acetylornithine deacetylase/succinyl-diaminopimelate desuccinylase-like protein
VTLHTHSQRDGALAAANESFAEVVKDLIEFSRIPSISANPPPDAACRKSAEFAVRMLQKAGLENCRLIEVEGAHPYAYGDWLHAKDAPTVLLYAHHDVQPPGRADRWLSPAFEPTERDGRLYGRGVVDDKAGAMIHVAALRAWLRTTGKLPVNVKFIIEGEEEIGSEHLPEFLKANHELLRADVICLTDTANLETGMPSLTVGLRGLTGAKITVTSLTKRIHSGMWGGPIPDPAQAMAKILARLVDDHGRVAIPGIKEMVRKPGKKVRDALAKLPFDRRRFASQAGLAKGVKLLTQKDTPVYEQLWWRPSVTVVALEAQPLAGSSNQILDSVSARVSLRLVPDMDPKKCERLLVKFLRSDPPFGVKVEVEGEGAATWWTTEPVGPAFDAARRALESGYGEKVSHIGCGGTIPFVKPFADAFGGAPVLCLGLEDPICDAHGENESLHLGDFRKGILSAIHLYEELAK